MAAEIGGGWQQIILYHGRSKALAPEIFRGAAFDLIQQAARACLSTACKNFRVARGNCLTLPPVHENRRVLREVTLTCAP